MIIKKYVILIYNLPILTTTSSNVYNLLDINIIVDLCQD